MSPLRTQIITALQLNGKGERTQEAYVREVRMLSQFYKKSPDLVSEEEFQHYFLHRKNDDNLSASSMRICYSAIKFFDQWEGHSKRTPQKKEGHPKRDNPNTVRHEI